MLFDRYRVFSFGCKLDVDMFCREVVIFFKFNSLYVISFVGVSLDDLSVSVNVWKFIDGLLKCYLFLILIKLNCMLSLFSILKIDCNI